jgi:hypothetical protein
MRRITWAVTAGIGGKSFHVYCAGLLLEAGARKIASKRNNYYCHNGMIRGGVEGNGMTQNEFVGVGSGPDSGNLEG